MHDKSLFVFRYLRNTKIIMAIQIQSFYFMNFKLFTFVDKTDETAQ